MENVLVTDKLKEAQGVIPAGGGEASIFEWLKEKD